MGAGNAEVLRLRALRLSELARAPGWDAVIAAIEERRATSDDVRQIVLDLLADLPAVGDEQGRVDHAKGFDDALKWVMRLPEGADKELGRIVSQEAAGAS